MKNKIVELIDGEIKTLEEKKALITKQADDKEKARMEREALERKAGIMELVKVYNEAEDAQKTRLNEIFFLIRALPAGYKKVTFSNDDIWSNCWKHDDKMSLRLCLEKMTRLITKVEIP